MWRPNGDPGFGDTWPVDSSLAPCLGFVGPNYTLPGNVGTLSQTNFPLTGAVANSAPVGCSTDIPWTVTFQLKPAVVVVKNDNQDDTCAKAAVSSVGCQNQSWAKMWRSPALASFCTTKVTAYPAERRQRRCQCGRALAGWLDPECPPRLRPWLQRPLPWRRQSAQRLAVRPMVTLNGNTLITPEDGSEIYVFSSTGQHLQTLTP